ncbi:hypothetical protein QQP08_024817 [Theobroma cacao]|nr:hypothetical protein QQP08_024817 [Theobroma cacao]
MAASIYLVTYKKMHRFDCMAGNMRSQRPEIDAKTEPSINEYDIEIGAIYKFHPAVHTSSLHPGISSSSTNLKITMLKYHLNKGFLHTCINT